MRKLTPAGQQLIEEVAQRHGFSTDAVMSMLESVIRGNGSMAQFNHPEFGGSGQWMRGGMTMVSDPVHRKAQVVPFEHAGVPPEPFLQGRVEFDVRQVPHKQSGSLAAPPVFAAKAIDQFVSVVVRDETAESSEAAVCAAIDDIRKKFGDQIEIWLRLTLQCLVHQQQRAFFDSRGRQRLRDEAALNARIDVVMPAQECKQIGNQLWTLRHISLLTCRKNIP
jgi:hypothetical protein